MLGLSLLLLSYDKGVAGPEDSMLEFVHPEELVTSVEQKHGQCMQHGQCRHDHEPLPLKADEVNAKLPLHAMGQPAPQNKMASYKLGNGDKIKISVFGEKELSDTYLVNEEGYISVPLVGDIDVKGHTIQGVRDILVKRLSDGYLVDPSVAIEVAEFRPIYIMGEVRDPGRYSFSTDMTVRNAVALAGGFTYRAKQDSFRILRDQNKNTVYQIEGVKPDTKIEPGDTILVKERFF